MNLINYPLPDTSSLPILADPFNWSECSINHLLFSGQSGHRCTPQPNKNTANEARVSREWELLPQSSQGIRAQWGGERSILALCSRNLVPCSRGKRGFAYEGPRTKSLSQRVP